ncbi:MAG: hypothetical protein M0R77_07890 [Gammaproteobacteria bacterium]|nr:hypothetical protein [Gammaproteobacteria bacterium]
MAHKAIIAKIDKVETIPGADRIQIAYVLGEPVVVSKDLPVGFIGVFFPVDVQLSEQYCRENNLFRNSEKNADSDKKGFFDDNRKVRAQPFLKVRSSGYFSSLESLAFCGEVPTQLGTEFDELNGVKICQKYITEQARKAIGNQRTKTVKANAFPLFEKHSDTDNFRHFAANIPVGALLSFHNKRHGTSMRVAKMRRTVELPRWKKLINKIAPIFPLTGDYEMVVGSRNVTLQQEYKEGFHGSESFRFEVGREIYPLLEDGMTVYGEIVGFVNGKAIMPNGDIKALKDKRYTEKYGNTNVFHYGCTEGEYKWHIYRITRQTVDGKNIDLSQKEMEQWCENRGIESTFEVHPQMIYNGDEEALRELVEKLTERPEHLGEDHQFSGMIGEGIIVRVDTNKTNPKFFKCKSYPFRVMEGLADVVDMETVS